MSLRSPLALQPYDFIGDSAGRPLDNGLVYIGQQGKDPEFYPITVYLDREMTKPILQPTLTKGGFLSANGSFVELYAAENVYSVKVLDKFSRKVIFKGDMMRGNLADDILPAIESAVAEIKTESENVLAESVAANEAYAVNTVQNAINNTATPGGVLADTFLTATANGVGAVALNQRLINAQKIDFYKFGAIGNGIADDTVAIRKTIAHAAITGQVIEQNGGVFYVNTFNQTVIGGVLGAIELNQDIKLGGKFTIKATDTTVTKSIFFCGINAQDIDVDIEGVYFDTVARNRAFYATTEAVLNKIRLRVTTKVASVVVQCPVKCDVDINNNQIGIGITATTAITPMFVVSRPLSTPYTPTYEVSNNRVVGGTEAAAGMFVIHNVPQGGKCEKNVVIDLGRSGTEGFDIDGLGQFAHFSKNVGVYCGFEYKTSSGSTIESSRDAFFHDNYSYEANTPFSIRSSCNARGNVAYNPTGWGLFMGFVAGSDPAIAASALCDVGGFTVIWAGSNMAGAARIGGTFQKLSLKGFRCIIDPIYAQNNPSAKLPSSAGAIVHIKGDGIKDIDIDDLYIDKSAVAQLLIRSETAGGRVKGITLTNPTFRDCDVACIDAMGADNLTIIEPDFPEFVGDRVIKASDCIAINVQTRNATKIDNLLTNATNIAATINNYGISNNTGSGIPLNGEHYRVGALVKNNFDKTHWLKISAGSNALAWQQIAQPITLATTTTAALSIATNTINTTGKTLGVDVYNSTTNKKYYAIGTTATAAWRPYDASADIVPV